jgi:hypothetical protein
MRSRLAGTAHAILFGAANRKFRDREQLLCIHQK